MVSNKVIQRRITAIFIVVFLLSPQGAYASENTNKGLVYQTVSATAGGLAAAANALQETSDIVFSASAQQVAQVSNGSGQLWGRVNCALRDIFSNNPCYVNTATTEVTDSTSTSPSTSVPYLFRPVFDNQFITQVQEATPNETVIRETVVERTVVTEEAANQDDLVTKSFLQRQIGRTSDTRNESQGSLRADLETALSTGRLTVSGTTTLGVVTSGDLTSSGQVQATSFTATDASESSTFLGDVSIGTTTTGLASLTVDGAIYLAATTPTATTSRLYNSGGTLYWDGSPVGSSGGGGGNWSTDGTNVWRASSSVGIGTTTPAFTLDVNGTGRFTGNLTAEAGIDVVGNLTVTGTVDSRDIAADGTKLDGIESGATSDQTAAEILTALLTVDGTGSTLDADTLDGVTATTFALDTDVDDLSGVTNASTARTNLGLAIGTNVQAYDPDLTTWAGVTSSANGRSLVSAANYAAMRALLDLEAGTDFYSIASADTAFESELNNSAGLAAALSDETGSGNAVFSASPTFTGTTNLAAATLSSALTMSGTAANIALGANYLSGDGGDEGVAIASDGTVTTSNNLDVNGTLVVTGSEGEANDGLVQLGGNATYHSKIFYDFALGDLFIDNTWNDDSGVIQFRTKTNGTPVEALTITGNGNIGIGTATPGAKLSVQGGATVGSSYVATAAPSNGMIIQGNVGIGTTSPASKLHIEENGDNVVAELYNSDTTNGYGLFVKAGGTAAGRYVAHFVNAAGASVMQVGGNGNVGIGLSSPSVRLQTAGGDVQFNDSANNPGFYFDESTGRVGLGTTTPSSKLTVAGDAYITGALRDSTNSAGTDGYLLQTTSSGTQWVATSTLGFDGGSDISFGTDGQLPFMNAGGTDFAYSGGLTFGSSTVLQNTHDISTAAFDEVVLDVSGQDATPYAMLFNDDGTTLYVLGAIGDDINEYTLSTAYDISTATFDSIALSVTTQEGSPTDMVFNDDGTVLYVLGDVGNDINAYTLSTAYDISTASFDSIALSVAAQETTPFAMVFNGDGTSLYVAGITGDDINEYTLSTPYDISTATFDSIALSVAAQEATPSALLFNEDGTSLYLLGITGDDINEYTLSTPYDISTATFDSIALSVAAQEANPTGMIFNNNGTKLYVSGDAGNDISAYDVGSVSDGPNQFAVNSLLSVTGTSTFSGNVGIGLSSPSVRLQTAGGDVQFNDSANNPGFYFDESTGRVGLGTTTPSSKLTVSGDAYIIGAFRDSTNSAGTSGMVLQTTGAGTQWVATSTLGFAASGAEEAYSYALDNDSWEVSSATLPDNVVFSQSAVIGNFVYLFGNFNTDNIYRAPVSDPTNWSATSNDLPDDIIRSQTAVIGDYVYLFGGFVVGGNTDNIYRAPVSDPTSWSDTGSNLPGRLSQSQTAVIGDYVYLFGGNNNAVIDIIWRAPVSDPTNWSDTGSTLPGNLANSQTVVIGDYVYLLGGYDGSAYIDNIYRAPVSDPTNWSDTGNNLPGNLSSSQTVVVGDYVYLLGGYDGSAYIDNIYRAPVSDPTSWSDTGSTLPGNLGISQVAIIGDKIYLFGGAITNVIYSADITSQIETDVTVTSHGAMLESKGWKYKPHSDPISYFAQGGDTLGALSILGTNDAYGLAFETNNTERLRIDSLGNVAIGTSTNATSTDAKLTVAGDAYITGAFRDSANSAGTSGMVLQTTGAGTQWVATSSLGLAPTYGTDGQLAFMNAGGTDFAYSNKLLFGDNTLRNDTYDLSTAVYDEVALTYGTETEDATSMIYNNDGTILYVLDEDTESVIAYPLSTAYDVSTGSTSSATVAATLTNASYFPEDMMFNGDGTTLYVLDDAYNNIDAYTLSSPYDITSITASSTATTTTTHGTFPRTMLFNDDGTELYMGGQSVNAISVYTLDTPYDISSASYVSNQSQYTYFQDMTFNDDGTVLYALTIYDDINKYTLSVPYDVTSGVFDSEVIAHGAQESDTNAMLFNNIGTALYLTGGINDDIDSYTVGTSVEVDGLAIDTNVAITGTASVTGNLNLSGGLKDNNNSLGTTGYVLKTTSSGVEWTDPSSLGIIDFGSPGQLSFTNASSTGLNYSSQLTFASSTLLQDKYDISTATFDSVVLSVAAQETVPQSMIFNNDGTALYVLGFTGDDINEYTLSTPYDISTATFNEVVLSVSSQDTIPSDMLFNDDGTVLYVLGISGADINEYTLSTPYDISTAVYNDLLLTGMSSQELGPTSMLFNDDGTVLYLMGTSGDDVNEYTLSTPYDISTATFDSIALSVAAQEISPQSMIFNNDGTILYVMGTSGDDINAYTLSTPYDISTATFDSIVVNVAAQDPNPTSMLFDNDGATLYVLGQSGVDINSYSLGTSVDAPFNELAIDAGLSVTGTTTLSSNLELGGGLIDITGSLGLDGYILQTTGAGTQWVATSSLGFTDISFGTDGQLPFMNAGGTDFAYSNGLTFGSSVIFSDTYDISTATFDSIALSVAAQDTYPYSLIFNNDGTTLYVLGENGDDINEYTLSTPYDISTATFDSIALSVAGQDFSPSSLLFNNDGTVLYVSGYSGSDINEYTLSTPYDISTATFDSIALDVSSQDTGPSSLIFNNDGTVLYMLGIADDDINEYTLSTPYDISTATFDSIALSVAAQEINPQSMLFSSDGSTLYVLGRTGDDINEYTLSIPYEISTATFDSIALSVAAQDTSPYAMIFNDDGSVLYVMGGNGFSYAEINMYNLGSSENSPVELAVDAGLSVTGTSTLSGNVGIGMTNPAAKLDVWGTGTSDIFAVSSSTGSRLLTVTSSGNVGIGTTSPAVSQLHVRRTTTSGDVLRVHNDSGNTGVAMISFRYGSGQTEVGYIGTNGSSVTYNTTSDRRVKENIDHTKLSLDTLMELPVRDFAYNIDPSTVTTGFIAQEVYEIFPWAVTTNGDNGIDPLTSSSSPWAVDYGRITPLIVKGVQDLNLKLEGLASSTAATSTLNVDGEQERTFVGRFFARLTEWLADSANGIGDFFASRVSTEELCVGDGNSGETCITKNELDSLLQSAAVGSSGGASGEGENEGISEEEVNALLETEEGSDEAESPATTGETSDGELATGSEEEAPIDGEEEESVTDEATTDTEDDPVSEEDEAEEEVASEESEGSEDGAVEEVASEASSPDTSNESSDSESTDSGSDEV